MCAFASLVLIFFCHTEERISSYCKGGNNKRESHPIFPEAGSGEQGDRLVMGHGVAAGNEPVEGR